MADDIDDLLEEIEQKFIKVNRQPKTESVSESIQQPGSSLESDMTGVCDDILKDIDSDIEEELVLSENKKIHKMPFKKKCFPVYLGGSLASIGLANIGCPRFHALYIFHFIKSFLYMILWFFHVGKGL